MKLNNHQLEFILTFFEDREFINWKEIATDLITKGSCICQKRENMWKGHLSWLIKSRTRTDIPVGCIEYLFNVEEFTHGEFFYIKADKEIYEMNQKRRDLLREANNLEQKINSIKKLITYE